MINQRVYCGARNVLYECSYAKNLGTFLYHLSLCSIHYVRRMNGIRGTEHSRKGILLILLIGCSCMVGILIGVYTDVVAVASTIKRLAGNQVMTIYYKTSYLPDRLPLITRNFTTQPQYKSYIPRLVNNDQLDAAADKLEYVKTEALLTLFTTFKNDIGRDQIHKNVLHNWAAFKPHVIPVLFNTDTDPALVSLARRLGWEVLTMTNRSAFDVPYLKIMFEISRKTFDSVFQGYSNGDLLFDEGLINTLAACQRNLTDLQQILVIGQRYNYPSKSRPLFKPGEVAEIARTNGQLFRTDAEDYFILGPGEYPWDEVPGVVVGRPGYDNFLVSLALQRGVSVIDATPTLIALHQSGKDGNLAGFINKDNAFNYKTIGIFNYDKGLTSNAPYTTFKDNPNGNISVVRR